MDILRVKELEAIQADLAVAWEKFIEQRESLTQQLAIEVNGLANRHRIAVDLSDDRVDLVRASLIDGADLYQPDQLDVLIRAFEWAVDEELDSLKLNAAVA
jgi:hypothetical protein